MTARWRIRNQKDFGAGCIFVLAGAGFAIGAMGYRVGDAARMGPGWFPLWIGVLLVLIGLVTAISSLRANASPEQVKRPGFASLAWILGAVVLFGMLLQPAGLVVSLLVLVVVSSMGSHEFRWRTAIINAVVLTVFSVGVFIHGINLQIGLWPAFLN